ncbi:MAG: ImuA family protein [Variibacter sp.]
MPQAFNPAPEAGAPRRRALVARLRQAIRAIEQRHETLAGDSSKRPFGIAEMDEALGGGLTTAALHEVAAANEPAIVAATGFALSLAAGATGEAPAQPILWVAEDMSLLESGAPYGPGLDAIGLRPERLITVSATHPRDVLWAMEEGLRCRALAAVLGEMRAPNAIDDVAMRRLSLAAGAHETLALLLRPAVAQSVVAETRWVIGPAASASPEHGVGPPTFHAQLVRNRHGRLGAWDLEWNCVEQRFRLTTGQGTQPADPLPVASASADRPDRAVA